MKNTLSAGWYADPSGMPFERYWDGAGWSEDVRPRAVAAAPLLTAPEPKARSKKKIVVVAVAAVIGIGALGSTLSKNHKDGGSNAGSAADYATVPSATNAPASTPSATRNTVKRQTETAATSHKLAVHKQKARAKRSSRASGDGSFPMPNELGRGLQAAQDDVQRVSGDPVFFSHSHDLIGDRFQVIDSDWQVCSQNVRPGTTVSAIGHIDFGVVKLWESCP